MRRYLVIVLVFSVMTGVQAQLADSCKLLFGTNMSGLSDWGSEQPFVDMMRSSREWYTKDVGNPNAAFDSQKRNELSYLANGYPTHVPQDVPSSPYKQEVVTIWGLTSGWEPGDYVVTFEGEGKLRFWGGYEQLERPTPNRYTFHFPVTLGNIIEMVIEESKIENPIQNIKIFKKEYEATLETKPFNPRWLEIVRTFPSVRFMDWGRTNNWSQAESWDWDDSTRINWKDRAKYDYYTWTTNKGIPYEMMVKLMNDYEIDGWVCVPHLASSEYQRAMAQFFKDHLNADRKITVEYSNEIWNWMFGQAQWLNKFGCVEKNIPWPEGTVPYIQECMDNWSDVFGSEIHRIKRVVGVQTGWLDVAQRTCFNMRAGSFDAVGGTYYFGISEQSDAILDAKGSEATVQELASMIRQDWIESKQIITALKEELADVLQLPIAFYEGGQHVTPHPFGEEPSYGQALIDIQRDSSMYNIYNEWYDYVRTLQEGEEPLQCMNFSLIAERSARYGSWGLLETMYQDTAVVPAPKYRATLENIFHGCFDSTVATNELSSVSITAIYPNPASDVLYIEKSTPGTISVFNIWGQRCIQLKISTGVQSISTASLPAGMYFIRDEKGHSLPFMIVK